MLTLSHYVNGKHTETSQRQQPIYEPASGELRGHVSLACKQEVSNAIEIAKQAYQTWSQVTPLNRARVLFKFKALMEQNIDELAELITREHGKVLEDAKGELVRGLEVVEFVSSDYADLPESGSLRERAGQNRKGWNFER